MGSPHLTLGLMKDPNRSTEYGLLYAAVRGEEENRDNKCNDYQSMLRQDPTELRVGNNLHKVGQGVNKIT